MALTYGFVDYAHAVNEAITTIGLQATYDAVVESARYHSDQIRDVYSLFVSEGVEHQELVKIVAAAELQPITDQTQPDPIRILGQYTQGYPMKSSGIAFGTDRVSAQSMTVGDANRQTLEMLKADARFLKRHILAALMTKDQYTFVDEKHGSLTVVPLANGDSVTYNKINGTNATANHYLGMANAIDDDSDNPFPTIHSTLMSYESNRGLPVMCFVPDNLVASIEALTGYVPIYDPAIIQGSDTDIIASSAIPNPGPGEEVIGRVDRCWICKWSAVPDSYIVSVVLGAADPVVRHRIMPFANLQGFFPEQNGGDGNLRQLNLLRYAGFGVRNRLAAHCTYIGNATYANPASLTAPLAA